MRACYVLLVALTTLLASVNGAPSAVTNLGEIELSSIASANTAPSPRSLSVHGNNDNQNNALRGTDTDGLDDDVSEDDLDGQEEEENEEERAGGTSLVKSIHNIKDYRDAKMLRQIAKGNDPEHILDKFNVAYKIINGERVYSKHDPDYQRYVKWVKYHRDK
ncbi:hypothetical protein PHYBOEH_010378 [Phytophthora boehmeriae]|uniref:RxLR effector protein n=1 Tax=Phytophthora boehmeriae TaxID=109152 RepID=A0A8T1VN58_9STRA|nr:hypothetical protein PHYBOEH_010378 [Phytophthora boehmeriae]